MTNPLTPHYRISPAQENGLLSNITRFKRVEAAHDKTYKVEQRKARWKDKMRKRMARPKSARELAMHNRSSNLIFFGNRKASAIHGLRPHSAHLPSSSSSSPQLATKKRTVHWQRVQGAQIPCQTTKTQLHEDVATASGTNSSGSGDVSGKSTELITQTLAEPSPSDSAADIIPTSASAPSTSATSATCTTTSSGSASTSTATATATATATDHQTVSVVPAVSSPPEENNVRAANDKAGGEENDTGDVDGDAADGTAAPDTQLIRSHIRYYFSNCCIAYISVKYLLI